MMNGRSSGCRTSPRTSVPSPRTSPRTSVPSPRTSPRTSVPRPSSLRSVSSSIPARSSVSSSIPARSSVSFSSSFSVSSSTLSPVGSSRILGHNRPGDSMPAGRRANLSSLSQGRGAVSGPYRVGGSGRIVGSRRIEEGGRDEEEEKLKKCEDEVEHCDNEKKNVNAGEEEEEQQLTVALGVAAPSALSTFSGSHLLELRDTLTHLLWEMRNQREIFGQQVAKVKGLVDKLEATFDDELNISESYIELANAVEVDINGGSLASTRYSDSSSSSFPKREQRHSKVYLRTEQTGEVNVEKAAEKVRLPVMTLSGNVPAAIETSAPHVTHESSPSNLSAREPEVVAFSVSATNAVSPASLVHAPCASSSTVAIPSTRALHTVSHSPKRPTVPPLTNLPLPSTHPTSASVTLSTSLHSVSLQAPSLVPTSFPSLPMTATTRSIPSHESYPKQLIDPKSPNQPLASSSSSSSSSLHTTPLLSHRSSNVDVGLTKIESSSGSSPFPRTGGEREKSFYPHSLSVKSYQPSLYSSFSQGSSLPILPLPISKLPSSTEGSSSSSAIGSNSSSVPFTPPWKYRDDISVGEVSTFCPDLPSTYGSPDRATIYCTAMSTSSLSPSLSFPSTSVVSPPSRSTTEALRQEVGHGLINGSVSSQEDRRPASPGKEEMRTTATLEFPHNDHHSQAEQALAFPSLPLHSLLPESTAAPSRLSWREETRELGRDRLMMASTSSISFNSSLPLLEEQRISSMDPHPHSHISSTTVVGTPPGEISGNNPLELLQCQIRQIRRAVRHGIPMSEAVEIILGEGGGDFVSSWSENSRGINSSTSISPLFLAWEKSNENKSSSNSSSANSATSSQFDIYSPTPVSTARAKFSGVSLYAGELDNRDGSSPSPPGATDASAEVAHHPSFTRERRSSPSPFPMATAATTSVSALSQLSSNTTISGISETFGRSSSMAGIVSSSSGSTVLGSVTFAASGRVAFSDGFSPFPVIVEEQDETVVVPTTAASTPVVPTTAASTPVFPTTAASTPVVPTTAVSTPVVPTTAASTPVVHTTTTASIPDVPTTPALTPVVPTTGALTGSSSRSCPSSAIPHYVSLSPQSEESASLHEPKNGGGVSSQRRSWFVSPGEMTPKGVLVERKSAVEGTVEKRKELSQRGEGRKIRTMRESNALCGNVRFRQMQEVNSTTARSRGCPATDDMISIKLRLNIPSVGSTEFEGQGSRGGEDPYSSEKPLEVRVLDPETNALIRQPFQELSNKVNLHYPEQNIMTVLVQDGAETVAVVRVRVVEEEEDY